MITSNKQVLINSTAVQIPFRLMRHVVAFFLDKQPPFRHILPSRKQVLILSKSWAWEAIAGMVRELPVVEIGSNLFRTSLRGDIYYGTEA